MKVYILTLDTSDCALVSGVFTHRETVERLLKPTTSSQVRMRQFDGWCKWIAEYPVMSNTIYGYGDTPEEAKDNLQTNLEECFKVQEWEVRD